MRPSSSTCPATLRIVCRPGPPSVSYDRNGCSVDPVYLRQPRPFPSLVAQVCNLRRRRSRLPAARRSPSVGQELRLLPIAPHSAPLRASEPTSCVPRPGPAGPSPFLVAQACPERSRTGHQPVSRPPFGRGAPLCALPPPPVPATLRIVRRQGHPPSHTTATAVLAGTEHAPPRPTPPPVGRAGLRQRAGPFRPNGWKRRTMRPVAILVFR